ncbi:hypothetical protein EJ02DRAFT_431257 [Clathrospora elynae]|uniref:Uncharacterized protein n=1 Tax=Clathrospora elynae TaxID=706981 RepID=A0A6A5T231_9PLEO|nr:hypothetical protein EJ02DRAFT_431257 [Clathrospora elynae]
MATTFHDWPRLSAEIKLEILSYHLRFELPIGATMHKAVLENELGNILRTRNQDLAALALEAYYKGNAFAMSICRGHGNKPSFSNLPEVNYPPKMYARLVKTLKITVGNCNPTVDEILLPQSGWRFLLTSQDTLESTAYTQGGPIDHFNNTTAWQKLFSNVQKLDMTIIVSTSLGMHLDAHENWCPHCSWPRKRLASLSEYIGQTEIGIQTARVNLDLRIDWGTSNPQCACLDTIEGLLKGMMTKK